MLTASKRPSAAPAQFGCGARPLMVLLASSFVFLAFLATARSAHADDAMPGIDAAEIAPPPIADVLVPVQDSVTDQTSTATADAGAPEQSNVAIVIRINSPGDDDVSQTNLVSVGATAANGSSTNQNQAAGAGAAVAQTGSEGSRPPVSAAPRGKVILAANARASAIPRIHASAPARRNRHTEAARRSSGAAPAFVPAPSRDVRTAERAAPARGIQATVPARAEQDASPAAAGKAQPHLANWLGGEEGRTAAATALAADSAKRSDLGALTLAALLAGLAACAGFAWLPQTRNLFRLRARA